MVLYKEGERHYEKALCQGKLDEVARILDKNPVLVR